jgi:hypothetical protein
MAASVTSDDQLNDALYAAPLESFIAERTRLVAELRKAGDKAGAARLAKAVKPTVSAWAVNQLARHEREVMQRLVDAGARMRDAQMSGADREAFAAAAAAQREALGQLREAAERILTEGGHGAAPAVLERVARNLRASGASEELAHQIQAGCLVADLDAETFDGFAALAGAAPPAPHPPRPRATEPAPAHAKAEQQRRDRERADRERELARARRAVEETTIRASRTREAAVRARRAAEEAEAEADAAETAAADARRVLQSLTSDGRESGGGE